MSINSVVIVGRLTKDPELKYSQTGTAVARFTLAVNRQFKKDNQPEADFISCVAFSKTAENLCNLMRKGSQIGVVGNIQTGSYEKDGQRVYTTDVIANNIQFLESKQSDGQQGYKPSQQPSYTQQPNGQPSYTPNNNQQNAPQQGVPQQNYNQYGGPGQQPNNQQSWQPNNVVRDDDLPF